MNVRAASVKELYTALDASTKRSNQYCKLDIEINTALKNLAPFLFDSDGFFAVRMGEIAPTVKKASKQEREWRQELEEEVRHRLVNDILRNSQLPYLVERNPRTFRSQ